MKILTVVGARPQLVKASLVSREIAAREGLSEVLVHTGQHFDENMSDIFFRQMGIPEPKYHLGINRLSHGAMTGKMLEKIEEVLIAEAPDAVLVYGDTNSTLAGALAAKKLHIKVAHVEAGLRSFNMQMPEETNRILTDRISDWLFAPTHNAVKNLIAEGYEKFPCRIENVGDVMYDVNRHFAPKAVRAAFDIPDRFVLATVHRQENTDDPQRLRGIFEGLDRIAQETPVILPLHPRTRKFLTDTGITTTASIQEPTGFLEMLYLLQHCEVVVTDSGGMQKEAFFHDKPCVTLRDETEWTELEEAGVNVLAGASAEKIEAAYRIFRTKDVRYDPAIYGTGDASRKIVEILAA